MSRKFQFSLKDFLLLIAIMAAGLVFGRSMAPKYAPKWGIPKVRHTGFLAEERIWPTGRIEQYRFIFVVDNCTPDIRPPQHEKKTLH